MVTFTVHYLMLRGFYANEDTRTPFFIQVVIAAVNIGLAYMLAIDGRADRVAMMLALAFGIAYLVGSILSATLLAFAVGNVFDCEMLVFVGKLVVAAASRRRHARLRRGARAAGHRASPSRRRCDARPHRRRHSPAPSRTSSRPGSLRMDQLTYLVETLRRRG